MAIAVGCSSGAQSGGLQARERFGEALNLTDEGTITLVQGLLDALKVQVEAGAAAAGAAALK